MKQLLHGIEKTIGIKNVLMSILLIVSLFLGYAAVQVGVEVPISLILFTIAIVFCVFLFRHPVTGLFITLVYSFVFSILVRDVLPSFQFGVLMELMLVLTLIAALFNKDRSQWKNLNNDLTILVVVWFMISVAQVFVPGASLLGWFNELRTTALSMLLVIPLTLVLAHKEKHLNMFLIIIIGLSLLGTLNGFKQLHIGLSPGEGKFVRDYAHTHLLWGKLRVFSFYTDAGQFGASQAHIALVALVLAIGPFSWMKRIVLIASALVLVYGLLISGTRGAFFVFSGGIFTLFLVRNFKLLVLGLVSGIALFAVLKFTTIGDSSYHIRRLRTALNPTEDASFNVRLRSQARLADYLESKPFGGGLGVTGYNARYNEGHFLATIEPDSYWVKIWAMYGIVGLVIWFCIMMYIIGKICGIIWNIEDPRLRIKLIALASGAIGVFISSYGNEVMNRPPSSFIVYISWALIYIAPRWDKKVLSSR